MERELVSRVCRCLDLQHHIVGINFLAYKEEYDNYDAQIPNLRRSICGYTSMALNGEKVKFDDSRVSCSGGALAVGLREEHDRIKSGRVYEH